MRHSIRSDFEGIKDWVRLSKGRSFDPWLSGHRARKKAHETGADLAAKRYQVAALHVSPFTR
jgi:hypothetical protein